MKKSNKTWSNKAEKWPQVKKPWKLTWFFPIKSICGVKIGYTVRFEGSPVEKGLNLSISDFRFESQ